MGARTSVCGVMCSVLLWVLLALGLSGCGRSAELTAMARSAAANLHLSTGREVERWERDNDVVLGKPVHAYIAIDYEPASGHTTQDVFAEIVTQLRQAGWQRVELNTSKPNLFKARLSQDGFIITAFVGIDEKRNIVYVNLDTTLP